MSKKMLLVDISRCVGCHSCQLACAVEHSASKDLVEALQEEPRPQSRVKIEVVDGQAVPLQCRHCDDAPCAVACPKEALEDLGPGEPVILHEDRCIGCGFCVAACPYGVITMRRDGKTALKCDLCPERIEAGGEPACVSACPTHALHFEEPKDWPEPEPARAEAAEQKAAGTEESRLTVDEEACKSCGRCVKVCPTEAISGGRKKVPATIDQELCVRCGACQAACKFEAIRGTIDLVACPDCGRPVASEEVLERVGRECGGREAVGLCPQCRSLQACRNWVKALGLSPASEARG